MNPVDDSEVNEADLIAEIAVGNHDAFRSLFRLHAPEVVSLCRHILHNQADAEDVASEVFYEIWSKIDHYDPSRSTLRSYLMLVARSRSIDLIRARKARRVKITIIDSGEVESNDPSPVQAASSNDLQNKMKAILNDLDNDQRTHLELAFFQGLSHSQISSQLDIPLGTVKSHIRKGLAKLKPSLRQFWGGGSK